MRAAAAVDVARRIDERSTELLSRNSDVERDLLAGDDALGVPSHASVEGAIEGDRVRAEIIPCHVHFAVRPDEWLRADAQSRSIVAVDTRCREVRSLVAGARQANAAAACCAE